MPVSTAHGWRVELNAGRPKTHAYYVSTGGGGAVANLTTRMRRYAREVDGETAEYLALNDKDGQPDYLITPDKVMTVPNQRLATNRFQYGTLLMKGD